jgi:hypothetical protein
VWPLLRHEADPSRRSYLIRDIGRFGIKADVVVGRLQSEADVSARRALMLILGAFDGDVLPAIVRTPLASKLFDLYRNDPDPGVHSAIDWLLESGSCVTLECRHLTCNVAIRMESCRRGWCGRTRPVLQHVLDSRFSAKVTDQFGAIPG